MAKVKAAKAKKPTFAPNGLPCLILIILGIILLLVLFYVSMKAS
jgi:hypothetical protein